MSITIDNDYADAYNNMGLILKEQGKLDKSIEAYDRALSIKPDYFEAYHNKGNALKDQNKLNEAVEAYRKSLSLAPNNLKDLLILVWC